MQQKPQELGIRMAWAQASRIPNIVLRQGMVLAAIGVAIGVGGALWLTHFLATFLFGVRALDPMAFISTLLLLSAVARRLDSGKTCHSGESRGGASI